VGAVPRGCVARPDGLCVRGGEEKMSWYS